MSRSGEISLPFGTEEQLFRLGIKQFEAIEERCDAGAPEILGRLFPLVTALQHFRTQGREPTIGDLLSANALGKFRIHDVREVHLQGLIGGGMAPTMAGILVRQVIDEGLSFEFAMSAYAILVAAWTPPKDEPLGEKKRAAGKRPSRRSRAARPDGATSTPPAP